MAFWDWFGKRKPRVAPTEDQMRDALPHLVMSDILKADVLAPVYRADVVSEEDFNARMAELPFIVVWNERETSQGLAFSMSVNGDRVASMIERYIVRQDPWFAAVHSKLVHDIRVLTSNAMAKTVELSGAPPSQICASVQALAATSEPLGDHPRNWSGAASCG